MKNQTYPNKFDIYVITGEDNIEFRVIVLTPSKMIRKTRTAAVIPLTEAEGVAPGGMVPVLDNKDTLTGYYMRWDYIFSVSVDKLKECIGTLDETCGIRMLGRIKAILGLPR